MNQTTTPTLTQMAEWVEGCEETARKMVQEHPTDEQFLWNANMAHSIAEFLRAAAGTKRKRA